MEFLGSFRNSFENFKKKLMTLNADYLLVYINDLDGYEVEKKISNYLSTIIGCTKLSGKNSGTWAVLLKPIPVKRFIHKNFEIIRETNIPANQETKLDIIIHGVKGTKIEIKLNNRNVSTLVNFVNLVLDKNKRTKGLWSGGIALKLKITKQDVQDHIDKLMAQEAANLSRRRSTN